VRQWHSILSSDIAHIALDEAGGPARSSGATVVPLRSTDGIIDVDELDKAISMRGPVHHSQPRIVSITQSTENGRLWHPDVLDHFIDHAHRLDLLVHIDGSRIANAVAALGATPARTIGDADIVTIGGTKNGMMFGDAVLVRRPHLFEGITWAQKQIGHLASKNRYACAQFDALFRDGLWLRNAAQANTMAARLSAGMATMGLRLATPTEANEVFVHLPPSVSAEASKHYALHVPEPRESVYRFVCSWSTTCAEVDAALALLQQAVGQ
jgi:threonine aldolase